MFVEYAFPGVPVTIVMIFENYLNKTLCEMSIIKGTTFD